MVILENLFLESTQGNFAAANAHIDRLLELKNVTSPGPNMEYAYLALFISIAALNSGDLSRLQSARACADVAISSQSVTPVFDLVARLGLALRAVLTHDEIGAREQYSAITDFRESTRFLWFSVDRMLGLLAHTMGNLDDSQARFEDAIAFCRESGYVTELAWTLHDYADMLLERNDTGDRQRATAMLDEALQISTDLGMRPLMERVLSKRDILKA